MDRLAVALQYLNSKVGTHPDEDLSLSDEMLMKILQAAPVADIESLIRDGRRYRDRMGVERKVDPLVWKRGIEYVAQYVYITVWDQLRGVNPNELPKWFFRPGLRKRVASETRIDVRAALKRF